MVYSFREITHCNMCGADARYQKVLGKRLNRSQGFAPARKVGITTTVCKCAACGLIFANPQPVPVNIQDHYGIPPEEYWKETYFSTDDQYFQREIARLKDLMPVQTGMRSLDIGAGLGKQMKALDKAGFEAYGIEASAPFYERAISGMGISPDRLRLGMMEEIDYGEHWFDFISFGAVLEHLYDPAASIRRAMRWVKPGGLIHIEVPSSDWLTNKIINAFYRMTFSDYVGNLSPMHEPFHLYEFGLKSFERHAALHDYEIAFSEFYVCETFMPKILDKLLVPYMRRSRQGMQLCVWLRKK